MDHSFKFKKFKMDHLFKLAMFIIKKKQCKRYEKLSFLQDFRRSELHYFTQKDDNILN